MSTFTAPRNRLSRDSTYERPEKTITESLTKKDIQEQLTNFEEITNDQLPYVNINTLLRYISYDKKNKTELFRFGGLLVKVNQEYIILAGKNGLTFSAQRYTKNDKNEIIHTTRFFKKINEKDIYKSELDDTIVKSSEIIEQQNSVIEKQKKEILAMKKMLKSKK
jgi:hypothetical protein